MYLQEQWNEISEITSVCLSCLFSLTDVVKSLFTDIAVGAPYEENQEGAIYIYNGCKTGIFTKFSKRIPGSAVLKGIKSFGAALSKSYDMNGDTVNGELSKFIEFILMQLLPYYGVGYRC